MKGRLSLRSPLLSKLIVYEMGYIIAPLRGGIRGWRVARTPTYEVATLIVAAQTSLPLVAMYIELDTPRKLFLRAIAAPGQILL